MAVKFFQDTWRMEPFYRVNYGSDEEGNDKNIGIPARNFRRLNNQLFFYSMGLCAASALGNRFLEGSLKTASTYTLIGSFWSATTLSVSCLLLGIANNSQLRRSIELVGKLKLLDISASLAALVFNVVVNRRPFSSSENYMCLAASIGPVISYAVTSVYLQDQTNTHKHIRQGNP